MWASIGVNVHQHQKEKKKAKHDEIGKNRASDVLLNRGTFFKWYFTFRRNV
jgi:hypothetical protein